MKKNDRLVDALVISLGCMIGGGIIYGIASFLAKHNPPLWLILVVVFILLTIVIYLILDDD